MFHSFLLRIKLPQLLQKIFSKEIDVVSCAVNAERSLTVNAVEALE